MQRLACSPVQESVTAACLGFFTLRRSHWLDVPERVKYKLSVMVHRCLNGRAPQYLATLCVPVASVASRQHLRSATRHQLAVPSYRLSMYGRRAVVVAGLMTWNALGLPTQLRRPDVTTAAIGRFLNVLGVPY